MDDRSVDLQGAARLITGEDISPERQLKIREIGQKLNIAPNDELFAVLVALESYSHLFSDVPSKMAVAARDAANDVGDAARHTAEKVLAESITASVDLQAITRGVKTWIVRTMVGTVIVTLLIMMGVGYSIHRDVDVLTTDAQILYRGEADKAKEEIGAMNRSNERLATDAANRAAQATADAMANRLTSDFKNSIDLQVTEGLKVGRENAFTVSALLRLEYQRPGTLHALEDLALAGWQAIIKANPGNPCTTKQYDSGSQRYTCTLWAP